MEKKKIYKHITIDKTRIGDLLYEMNEREVPKDDIVFIGPTSTGYLVIYLG